jgi:ribosomal protein L11 methyltransferase
MPASPESWLEVSVQVAGIDAETIADIFRQACAGGAAIEPAHRFIREIDRYVVDGDGTATVRGYIPGEADTERIRSSLRLAVQAAPLRSPPRWRRARTIREESWRDAWKKHFGIQRIGKALVVAPTWIEYSLKLQETVIRIDPGMAFGTGQHPTTAMCLRTIEERVHPGASMLDLGCGSGILAIAAAKLGAARVLALDIDPLAVKATTENAAANGVSGVITAREGTLDVETPRRHVPTEARLRGASTESVFDVIAANISGLALERLAPALAASLSHRGVLIASGFLEDAVSNLSAAFEAQGLKVETVVGDGVWRAVIATPAQR